MNSGASPPAAGDRLLPARPAVRWGDHLDRHGPVPDHRASDLVGMLDAAGLVGRGGAGFPTARKIAAVAEASAKARRPAIVVANCCEGDPTSAKDRVLTDRSPHLVVDGAVAAGAALGADRIVLAVHASSTTQARLGRAVSERPVVGPGVEVVPIPNRYLASEATSLVRFLNTGDARPTGRLAPIWEGGVDGRPTLVANAETLAHLALIARYGPEWFAAVGLPAEPGTTLVTLGGAVARPGVVEIATGTPLSDVLARAATPPAGWALVGGLGGSWVALDMAADIGFSTAELRAAGAGRGVGSIVVLPAEDCLLVETARIVKHQAAVGARQCGPCMFGLPAIAEDLSALVVGDRRALTRLRRRLPVVHGRGACGHPDGTVDLVAGALSSIIAHQPGHLERHLRGRGCRPSAVVPLPSAVPLAWAEGGRR